MRPVICMITDRLRLSDDGARLLVARVAAAARAGVHLIQVRERDLDGGVLAGLVAACVHAVRPSRARILVNDRLDVAIAAGAHGVHLRVDSMSASRVRTMTPPGFLVGRSIHTSEEAARAEAEGALDYLLFGTVFPSTGKPEVPAAGIQALAAAAAATTIPVLALGGVTVRTAYGLGETGAAGFAAIGLFADDSEERLQLTVSQANLAFDTPSVVP